MALIYIQIRKNQITVRNIDIQQQATGNANFSTERLLVGDFIVAAQLLQKIGKPLMPRFNLPFNRPGILVHALEINQGGLSAVEIRTLAELCSCLAFRTSGLVIATDERILSDSAAKVVFAAEPDAH